MSARASYILKATSLLAENFRGQMYEVTFKGKSLFWQRGTSESLIALLLSPEKLVKLSCTYVK